MSELPGCTCIKLAEGLYGVPVGGCPAHDFPPGIPLSLRNIWGSFTQEQKAALREWATEVENMRATLEDSCLE